MTSTKTRRHKVDELIVGEHFVEATKLRVHELFRVWDQRPEEDDLRKAELRVAAACGHPGRRS
jgi:hypothetical protein